VTRVAAFETAEQEVTVRDRRLRLLRPRSVEALHDADDRSTPYWAELWPSALVLAGELARRDLAGVRAVELGCGLGLGAIVAALSGADVIATDVDPDAVAFARANGRRILGRRLATMRADLFDLPGALLALAPFDLVVAADVLYADGLADAVAAALVTLLRPGGEALVAYQWRGQADGLQAALGWPSSHREEGGARLLLLERPMAAVA
jgi:predicted nicotinamide N-methyase